jgi:hypothetical protein
VSSLVVSLAEWMQTKDSACRGNTHVSSVPHEIEYATYTRFVYSSRALGSARYRMGSAQTARSTIEFVHQTR